MFYLRVKNSGIKMKKLAHLYLFLTAAYAQTYNISTFAGGGVGDTLPATAALLNFPTLAVTDSFGNFIIAESNNFRVRMVNITSGAITTIAGTGLSSPYNGDNRPATTANLAVAFVAINGAGELFIVDRQNVRKVVLSTGIITSYAGTGVGGYNGDGGPASGAQLNSPGGMAIDSDGNLLIADQSNHRIRRIAAATGIITTVAGSGVQGSSGDGGPATLAMFSLPKAVAVDAAGNLFIAET